MSGRELAPNILLSIDPEPAEAILSGEKRYEYRRVIPKHDPPYRVVLYVNKPVYAALGVFWTYNSVVSGTPEEVIEETNCESDSVREYLDGSNTAYAIRVDTYRRFDQRVPRDKLERMDLSPTQNFRYIGKVPPDETLVEPCLIQPKQPCNSRYVGTDVEGSE